MKAPAGSAWQSCAPMATEEPCASAEKFASNVAGGHTIRSTRGAKDGAPAMILPSSADESPSPFIFQLPATRGRGVLAMVCS